MSGPYTASFSIVGTLLFQSTDVPAPINDWTAVGSYLTIDQSATIGDLNVRLNLSHTYDADLAIYLISPSGDYTFLSYFRGGSGNDFQDTLFDDEAGTPVASGSAPFAGAYQPDTPLSVYDGMNAQGVWQLWVEDWGYFDTGTLNSWSIEITPPGVTPPDPPPPDPPPPDPPPPDPPPENHAPLAGDDAFTGNEDQALVLSPSQLLANDSDPDGDALSISSVGSPSGVSVTLLGNGTINVVPNANFNGSASFSYTIQDSWGLSAVGQVSLNILPVNDPPVAVADSFTGNEDQLLVLATSQLLANDSDPEGDALSISSVGSPSHVSVTLLANGTINVTPNSNYSGSASFSYTVQDGLGGSTVGQVSLSFQPVNDPPVAVADSLTGTTGQAVVIASSQLLANDTDVDGNTLAVVGVSGAYNGTVNMANGQITFTPTAGFSGTAGFNYTISDGTFTASAAVTIVLQQPSSVQPGDYYFSLTDAATLTNSDGTTLSVADADIVRLRVQSSGTYRYTMYFDGSDVGLTTASEDIDAFYLEPNGALLFSTVGNYSVPSSSGPVTGTGSDVLAFYPTSLGTSTAGEWWVYFQGDSFDLTGTAENVDAIALDQDSALLLSTSGNFSVPGLSGTDADLLRFDWNFMQMYFDGSDVGLSTTDEDVDGLFFQYNPNGMPTLYFSTRGDFSVAGASGANEDIVRFAPTQLGPATSGSFNLAFDGSGVGLAGLDLDGIHLGSAPWEQLVTGAGASGSSSGVRSVGSVAPSSKTDGPPLQSTPAESPIASPGDVPVTRNPALTSPIASPITSQPATPPAVPRRESAPKRTTSNVPLAAAVDHLLAELALRRGAAKDNSPQPQAAKRAAAPEPTQVVVVDGISPLLSRGRKR